MRQNLKPMIVAVLSIFSLVFSTFGQQKGSADFEKMSFEVEMFKSNYLPLEPVFVRFRFSNQSKIVARIDCPDFLLDTSAKVVSDDKEIHLPSLTFTHRRPQKLPGQVETVLQPGNFCEDEKEIEGVLFPAPGRYRVQFVIHDSNGGRGQISSDVIEIAVGTPEGINKAAMNFLKNYENPTTFYWAWKEKDGLALLERFINDYSTSVYGESAIRYLGSLYLARGDLDKAAMAFRRIQTSSNNVIAAEALKSLSEIKAAKVPLR